MGDAITHRSPSAWSSILPALIVDGACPFLAYVVLRRYAGASELAALVVGALFPLARGGVEISRRRRVDIVGLMVFVGISVSVIALLAGGTPQVLLIRESFVTGALGLLALTSFVWPRPLMFYIGRQFSAGDDSAARAQFDSLWQHAGARRAFRLMTLVWAVGWLAEFGLRVVLILTLSVAQVLAISPVLFNGITLGLIAWTLAYAERQRRRGRARSSSRPDDGSAKN